MENWFLKVQQMMMSYKRDVGEKALNNCTELVMIQWFMR